MTRPSYSGYDSGFAEGLIAAIGETVSPQRGTQTGHWRPTAELGPPFGGIIGDAAMVYATPQYPGEISADR